MPIYGRKSFKIAPGLHLNVSKRGMGVSLGTRGGPRLTLGPTGRVTASQSLGNGIRYQKSVTLNPKNASHDSVQNDVKLPTAPASNVEHDHPYGESMHREHHGFWASYATWFVLSVGLLSYSIANKSSSFISGICTGFVILFFSLTLIDTVRK